jgi:hypothetical protein
MFEKRGGETLGFDTPRVEVIMRRTLFLVAFALLLSLPLAAGLGGGGAGPHGGSRGSSRGSSSPTSSSDGAKGIYVHGYTRKDGTYVSGYWRAAPGSASGSADASAHPAPSGAPTPATLPADAQSNVNMSSTAIKPQVSVRVLADPATKRYFRETCAAPASAIRILRSEAIATGYRPDPGCYATRKQ